MAEHSMRYLASPAVIERLGYGTSGVLLADRELRTEPTHITILGRKDDVKAQSLFAVALHGAPPSARIEWFDLNKETPPRNDVEYPKLSEPAAFLCANGVCSVPMTTPDQLTKKLAKSVH
jgi:uncharacterized protein YyaL (SSP411 family)